MAEKSKNELAFRGEKKWFTNSYYFRGFSMQLLSVVVKPASWQPQKQKNKRATIHSFHSSLIVDVTDFCMQGLSL